MSFLSRRNDLDIERAIAAMIVSPTLEDAVETLRQQGTQTTVEHLRVWRDREPTIRERYEKRRIELTPRLERNFANDLLDNARRASLSVRLAIEHTHELLEADVVQDPSRVARDLSQIVAQSTDKRLAIRSRPTHIAANRDVSRILRQLVALGVVKIDDAIESTAEDDT